MGPDGSGSATAAQKRVGPFPLRFSVVIPVLNLRGSLGLLLRCLEAQTFPRSGYECIIVDDGSTDGSREFLDSYESGFELTIIGLTQNLGRSDARNAGCDHARGEILIFLDGDVLPSPSWLSEYDAAFRAQNVDVLSGGRHSITVSPQNATPELSALLGVPGSDLMRGEINAHFLTLGRRSRLGQYPTPLYARLEQELAEVCDDHPGSLLCAFSFITANVGVYAARYRQTRGFCPFVVRLQDTELGLQLWATGCRFGFADAAKAYHLFWPAELDLDVNYRDVLSLFYRHPYKLVLKMVCWGLHRSPLSSKPRLKNLAASPTEALEVNREFAETFSQPAPVRCEQPLESLAEYAHERSGVPMATLMAWLRSGISTGLYADDIEGRLYVDRHHAINWLQNNTPFREADLRRNCCVNTITATQRRGQPSAPLRLQCRGRYEVLIPAALFGGITADASVQVPLPSRHFSQSSLDVELFEVPGVTACNKGDYVLYSWPVGATTPDIVVGYEFACDLQETVEPAQASDEYDDIDPYRQCTLPPSHRERAQTLLRRISVDRSDGPMAQAQAVYAWILEHYEFRESTQSNMRVFDTGVGPCNHAAKLFIELCRLLGIPAREQCGALLQALTDSSATKTVESVERGYSPFMHTWAEFYDAARGWVPVEFLGWMLGARSLTSRNVDDSALRSQVVGNTVMYDRYFFGHLDPCRVRSAATSNKLRTYPIVPAQTTWGHIHRAVFETRHRLTCTLTPLTAAKG